MRRLALNPSQAAALIVLVMIKSNLNTESKLARVIISTKLATVLSPPNC
jgi:hypothetical protein